jgi:glutaminyl-peptide cyclotransferase
MKRAVWLLLALAISCRREPSVARVGTSFPIESPGVQALSEAAAFAALGPKSAGTPGAARAVEHVRARLRALGVPSHVDAFTEMTPSGPLTFRNVIATIPGRGPGRVALLAHYDTKAGISDDFAGANDSASGVGLLLALAPVLQRGQEPKPTLLLGFLDGEECRIAYGPSDGLHGSRRLARQWRADGTAGDVRAVIVLDMIGDRDLSVTIPRNGTPALIAAVFRAAGAEGVRSRFGLAPGAILDDHQPFLDAGMPAVDVIDFEYGSAPGRNDYWHTPLDTVDKLSADSLGIVGRVALRVLNGISRERVSPPEPLEDERPRAP